MIDHDPLCWRKQDYVAVCSMCVLIGSVRADERERIVQGIHDLRRRMSSVGASDQTILALYDAAVIAQNGGK